MCVQIGSRVWAARVVKRHINKKTKSRDPYMSLPPGVAIPLIGSEPNLARLVMAL